MTSPNFICNVDPWPSATTFPANASSLLWVVTGAGAGAAGSFLGAIANEDMERVCCIKLCTLPVGHCEPPFGQVDQGSNCAAAVAAIHGYCGGGGGGC